MNSLEMVEQNVASASGAIAGCMTESDKKLVEQVKEEIRRQVKIRPSNAFSGREIHVHFLDAIFSGRSSGLLLFFGFRISCRVFDLVCVLLKVYGHLWQPAQPGI